MHKKNNKKKNSLTVWPTSVKCRATGDLLSALFIALLCSLIQNLSCRLALPTYWRPKGQESKHITFVELQKIKCLISNSCFFSTAHKCINFFMSWQDKQCLNRKKPTEHFIVFECFSTEAVLACTELSHKFLPLKYANSGPSLNSFLYFSSMFKICQCFFNDVFAY